MSDVVSPTIVEKSPYEEATRYISFAGLPEIVAGATLSGTPVVEELATTDLTIEGTPAVSGTNKVVVSISGGRAASFSTDGVWRTTYRLRCTCNSSAGKPLVVECELRVESLVQVAAVPE